MKLFQEEYEYYVNEQDKVVVAKFKYPRSYFINEINKKNCNGISTKYSDTRIMYKFWDLRPSLREEVVARAVCSPEDEFDPEIGKKIARKRLESKIASLWAKYFKMKKEFHWKCVLESDYEHWGHRVVAADCKNYSNKIGDKE